MYSVPFSNSSYKPASFHRLADVCKICGEVVHGIRICHNCSQQTSVGEIYPGFTYSYAIYQELHQDGMSWDEFKHQVRGNTGIIPTVMTSEYDALAISKIREIRKNNLQGMDLLELEIEYMKSTEEEVTDELERLLFG